MTKQRPVDKLAAASAKCAKSGAVYGNCVLKNYQDMAQGTCAKEFAEFRQCVQKSVSIVKLSG